MNNSKALRKRVSADFLMQLAAAEQAQLKCVEEQRRTVEKFWESMGDFPDLNCSIRHALRTMPAGKP